MPQRPFNSVRGREIWLLSIILLVALMLRIQGLTRGLVYDEIVTALEFVDVDSIWTAASSTFSFNNHIAYSISVHLAKDIFGNAEWALRLPALLLGVLTIPLLGNFARKFLSAEWAFFAMLALALAPVHIIYSQTARGYTGMMLFTLLSSCFFFKLLDRPSPPRLFYFVFANIVGIYFHLYAIFVLVVQIIFVLLLCARRTLKDRQSFLFYAKHYRAFWVAFLIILGAVGILYLPVIGNLFAVAAIRGLGRFDLLFPLQVIAEQSGGIEPLAQLLIFLSCLLGLGSLLKYYPREGTYFFLLMVMPIGVAWIAHPLDLYPRFFLFFLPYYILLMVRGLSKLWLFRTSLVPPIRYLLSLVGILAAMYVGYHWIVNSWNNLPKDGYREAAMEIEKGQTSLLCGLGGGIELSRYYTHEDLFLPQSLDEFEKAIVEYSQIRCMATPYLSGRELAGQRKIFDYLSAHSQVLRIENFTVFLYDK